MITKDKQIYAIDFTLRIEAYVAVTKRKVQKAYEAVENGAIVIIVYQLRCPVEEAKRLWKEQEEERRAVLANLPEEILNTVEDFELFFQGKMSKETKELLSEYSAYLKR